jgi:DNA adenine methylase
MRSPLTIWGGKYRAIPYLLPYFPEPSKVIFVDVFTGSGVVTLNYAPRKCIMNDVNENIYNFYRIMSGCVFERLMKEYPESDLFPAWKDKYSLYDAFITELNQVIIGKSWFESYRKRNDVVGKTIAFLILNRNNFSGACRKNFQLVFSDRPFVLFEELEEFFKDETRKVRVWNEDFRVVLNKLNKWKDTDNRTYYLYLDPPYPSQQEGYCKEHRFTEQDYSDLADLCREQDHHWIMSIEDSEFTRGLFGEFHIKNVQWNYSGQKDHSTDGTSELLLSNRPFRKRDIRDDNLKIKHGILD